MLTFINCHKFKNTFKIEECPCPKQEVLSLIRKSMFYKDKEKHINPNLAIKSRV